MVSICIPLSAVIAGDYKVALSPATVGRFKTANPATSNIRQMGGWISPAGKAFPLKHNDLSNPNYEEHSDVAEDMGFESNEAAREAGAIRIVMMHGGDTVGIEVNQLTPVIRSRIREFLSEMPEIEVVVEWYRPKHKSEGFDTSEEALDWLENRTVTAAVEKPVAASTPTDFKLDELVIYIGPGFLTYNPRLQGRVVGKATRLGRPYIEVKWNNGTKTYCEPGSLQSVHSQKQLFSSLFKTAISLPDLIQQTNAFSTKHRPGCVPALEKSDPKNLSLQYRVTCHNEDYNDPNGHETRVQFDVSKIKEDQNANELDVQCSCSCPAFLYWGAQWNLHQRDGLLGQPRPLLQAPTERLDLRSNFVLCKHCKAVFERILPSVQHNINNIERAKKVEEAKKRREEEGAPPPTIHRPPDKKKPNVAPEDIEDMARAETQRLMEQEGVIERETPATADERKRVPTLEKKPRWREVVDRLKERVKGWGVPTPEEGKQEPKPSEDQRVQDELLREERQKIKMPLNKEHPQTPHVDKGLPYEPKWKQLVKKLKDRVKGWGSRFKGK